MSRASSIETRIKLSISDLDHDVSSDAVKKSLLKRFSNVGVHVLERYDFHSDSGRRRKVTAEVVFSRKRYAEAAVDRYNNVKLYGKRMEIKILDRNPARPKRGTIACPAHCYKDLQLIKHKKTYRCDGCDMKGKGKGYRCSECDFVLHTHCMNPADRITPPFLGGDTLNFLEKPLPTDPRKDRYCNACGMTINGFNYRCNKTGFDLHPCCTNLKPHLDGNDGQRLTLIKKRERKQCDLCDSRSVNESNDMTFGWFYVSESPPHKLHVYCLIKTTKKSSSINTIDLANLENLPVARLGTGRSTGRKFLGILKMVLQHVIPALFGDPTMFLFALAQELLLSN